MTSSKATAEAMDLSAPGDEAVDARGERAYGSGRIAMLAAAAAQVSSRIGATARDVLTGSDDRARAQRNALFAFTVRVGSAALLYLTQIALARWMGTFEYGVYVFVWTWVLLLGGFASLGMSVATIRLVSEYKERASFGLLVGLTRRSRMIAVLVGTLVALAGAAGVYAFEPWIANYYVLPAYLALVCVPLYALGDVHDGLGRGHGWMGLGLVPPYILRPLMILAGMVAAHEAGLPMTATTAAICAIVATWASAILQLVLMDRQLAGEIPAGAGRDFDTRAWLATAAPLLVIYMCTVVLQNADVIIMSSMLTPVDVGIYFAAAKTMSLIMFVHYAVGSAVAHRFSALNARGDRAGLEAFAADAVRWTFWPSLVAGIVLLALGQPLLSLFGDQFTTGYPVMFVLVVGFLVRSIFGPTEFLLNMLGEQSRCALVLVVTAVLNIVLNLALIPVLGMMGGAVATMLSLVVSAVLLYVVARQRLGVDMAIWRTKRNAVSEHG
ncbi:MAG: flippase [Hyphomicrobiaceae bacterium]|nr:flippase [Hyphomicrobiaceae bacterium]